MKYPYQKVSQRIDVVKKVPGWAVGSVEVGQEVFRYDHKSVADMGTGFRLSLGESYTKFSRYQEK